MADSLSKEDRFRVMSHNRSVNTKPEILLRHALWKKGFRYRINDRRLPGSPDIVFPKYHTVVFMHGCFWHGHKNCRLYKLPQTNTAFWLAKVQRNQERDQETWRQLEAKGWAVIIVWECELKKKSLSNTVESVASSIRINGEKYNKNKEERLTTLEEYHKVRTAKQEHETILKEEIERRFRRNKQ